MQKTPIYSTFYRGYVLIIVWFQVAGIFLTATPENVDLYKLKELVNLFNLSDGLLN